MSCRTTTSVQYRLEGDDSVMPYHNVNRSLATGSVKWGCALTRHVTQSRVETHQRAHTFHLPLDTSALAPIEGEKTRERERESIASLACLIDQLFFADSTSGLTTSKGKSYNQRAQQQTSDDRRLSLSHRRAPVKGRSPD